MRSRRPAIAALIAWSVSAPALAAGGDPFDAAIAVSKAAMMANPADALARARQAEASAAKAPAGKPRMIAEATAGWLEGEATARLNRPADALATLQAAIGRAKGAEAGDKLMADILLSRGWAQGMLGQIRPALEDFQNAYMLYRRLGEVRGQAKALQNIGGIYHDAGDNERSLTYYSQVAELAGNDPAIGLAARNNLGETLKALGRYAAAQVEYRRALAAAKQLGSDLLQVRILTNLAAAQVYGGQVDAGEVSARRALALAHGEAAGERPFALGILALVAEKRHRTAPAARLLDTVFADQDLARTPLSFRDFHESAARVYAEVGQDRLAYRQPVLAAPQPQRGAPRQHAAQRFEWQPRQGAARQERISGDHQPRDPHAAQRHPGHDAGDARRWQGGSGAQGADRDRPWRWRDDARAGRRYPRHRQDRERQSGYHAGAV